MSTSVTAPNEGSASTRKEIADELATMLTGFDHIDYNALNHDELTALLDARETVNELCLRYRSEQRARHGGPVDPDKEGSNAE